MNDTITKETEIFRRELNEWRNRHNLSGADLSRILGTSRQMISDVLAGKKVFSAEKALQALQILLNYQKTHPMNTNIQDQGLDEINKSVLKRFAAKSNMRIKYFQGADDGSGFVNYVGSEEPDTADLLAQLVRDGRLDEAKDLLTQIQRGPKVTPSTSVQARPNAGPTRGTVHVTSNDGRKTVVDAQSFSTTANVLNVDKSKSVIEAARKQNQKEFSVGIQKSHKSNEAKVELNNPHMINCDRINKQKLSDRHFGSIADTQMQAATKRFQAVKDERAARLARGKGTVEDLSANLNRVMYLDSKVPDCQNVDSSVLMHEDAYFSLMLETEKLNK